MAFRDTYFRMVKKIQFNSPLDLIGYDKEKAKLVSELYGWIDPPMKHGNHDHKISSILLYVC